MIKKCISKEWKFKDRAGEYTDIDLPHDYAIGKDRSPDVPGGSSNGFYPDSKGKYVKFLKFDEEKHYILDIDGAYMCTQVFLNENQIGYHPHGYTPYLVELTPYILKNISNRLEITTTVLPMSTRWYSGNGIYRDVFLWEGGDIRIEPWDMFISTVSANEDRAEICLKFAVSADRDADIKVCFHVIAKDGTTVKSEEVCMQTRTYSKMEHEYRMKLDYPCLWDTENPYLYTLKTEIYEGNVLTDTSVNDFGIRTIFADAKQGLLLNGKKIKLRGGCIHHDHGVLGSAAFPAAEARKIRLLKEAGFNAVRIAHNPASLALLEYCDRVGMIVMEEAFDVWNKAKCENDYHLFFSDWCTRDISYMVLRDRNHPCVFSYSIGNEIFEIDGTYGAAKWSKILCDEIRKFDATRFVTSGIQKAFTAAGKGDSINPEDYEEYLKNQFIFGEEEVCGRNKVTEGFEAPLDIIGCNYYYQNYEREHECYPDRVIWGSETHAIDFFDSWKMVKENDYILGDFTWTAYDNIGEVGTGKSIWGRDGYIERLKLETWPWRTCYQGDLDLCGYRRPQSYFREAICLGNKEPRIFTTHPEHFGEMFSGTHWHFYDVNETWTFDRKYIGRPVKAETYTDADKIVWWLNGREIGESIPEKGIASIVTKYEMGDITAVAYKDGKECSRYTLSTVDEPAAIDIFAERGEFQADNRDLCYFDISVVDGKGRLVAEAEHEIKCTVYGGELMGIFSGNPCNEDKYTSNACHVFKGRAVAVVRAKNPGTVGVLVYSDELASGLAEVTAKV